MAKTKTIGQIVSAFRVINKAKLSRMEDAEKFATIKIVRQLKKVDADFQDLLKEAQEKLKPDGFDAIASKIQSETKLSFEESATVEKYDKDVTACVNDELAKEVELSFEPISDDALGRFFSSNDFSVSEMLTVSDVIGS